MRTDNIIYIGTVYMPDGRPAPELLTEKEAIMFLRLDENGPAMPGQTLQYYRDKGLLRATRVGKYLRYHKKELIAFLDKQTERSQKNAG